MKTLIAALALLALSGCAGLNVSWVGTASYNSPGVVTNAILKPGAEPEKKP